MAYQLPHEYELDRATSRLELIRENPQRSWIVATDRGAVIYTWQGGKWYDTGFNEIQDPEAEVPEQFRAWIAADPPRGTETGGPAVTAFCKICGETMNRSELNQHQLDHYYALQKQTGAGDVPPPIVTKDQEPKTKSDANRHTRG